MITARMIVLDSLDHLLQRPDIKVARELLDGWSEHGEEKLFKAACYYLIHYVIPSLQGEGCTTKKLPRWVDVQLFHPPLEEILSRADWMSLFPRSKAEGLYRVIIDEVKKTQKGESIRYADVPSDSEVEKMKLRLKGGIYFTPNGVRGWRKSENVVRFNACFADFDELTKEEQLIFIHTLPLKPSIIVESGNGYHVYWLLDLPITSKDEWIGIQERIVEMCGSDKVIVNPDRLMRMPFTWHTKNEEPFWVTIKEYTTVRYSIEEIKAAFPPKPKKIYLAGPYTKDKVYQPPYGHLIENHRHNGLKEIVTRTYAGLVKELAPEARAMVKDWYSHSCFPLKDDWEEEVDSMCDWPERRQYGGVVSR